MKSIRCAPGPSSEPRRPRSFPCTWCGGSVPAWERVRLRVWERACVGACTAGARARALLLPARMRTSACRTGLRLALQGVLRPQNSPFSPERVSAGILSMTCWPRGRGGLPIRNRSFPASTGESRNQNPAAESDWEPPLTPWACLAHPAASPEEAAPAPRGPLGGSAALGSPRAPRSRRADALLPALSWKLVPAVPHVLTRGCVHRSRSRCFVSDKEGKATTFLFRVFFLRYIGL